MEPGPDLRLPPRARARARPREDAAGWAHLLAQFAFALLLLLAFAGPWMTNQGDPALSALRERCYGAVLLLAAVAIRPWRHPERLLVVPWPLLLALGWCALSLTWAIEPAIGFRRLLLTAIVLWSVFALIREIGIERAVTILRVALAALLLVNFAVALLMPQVGIHGPNEADLAGDWRGVMSQKNWAGLTSAMAVLVFAFDAARVPLLLRIAVALLACLFLALADSATSTGVGAAALVIGALLAWRSARDGRSRLAAAWWAWVPLGLLAALIASMAAGPQPYLDMIRDPRGFTGRFEIWTALIRLYVDRPWAGVGYGSLWDLGPHGPITLYAHNWVAELSQGHNGYLDLLCQVGAPGTLLALFAALVWPLQRLLRGGEHPARVLGAAMLVFCLGHNFTESSLLDRDALGEVFLLIAIALLWRGTAMAVPGQADARGSPGNR